MKIINCKELKIMSEHDILTARRIIRKLSSEISFSILEETKIQTAASELIRNMLYYAGEGIVLFKILNNNNKLGLSIEFIDKGPGIEDIDLALKEGYSSHNGLGIGLPGSRRLVNQFTITSEKGKGTKIKIIRWKE